MALAPRKGARRLRRVIQALSLGLFVYLLAKAAWPLAETLLPPDSFHHLDPLASLGASLAARQWVPGVWAALALLVLTGLFGRFFCGYICPLGTTLDLSRRLLKLGKPPQANLSTFSNAVKIKYLALTIILVLTACGFNIYHWGSPLSLSTRLYGLLLHPLIQWLGGLGLTAGQATAEALGQDLPGLFYISLKQRSYDFIWPVIIIFLAIFWLEKKKPRFWCRYLCPTGAILSLLSLHPLWRRRVRQCVNCGQCARQCPTGAISPDGLDCRHRECLDCRACVDVCPVKGVSFSMSEEKTAPAPKEAPMADGPELPSRRAFITAAGAGLALAAAGSSRPAQAWLAAGAEIPVRPPGSVPESDFLALCMRCGLCLKACPGHILQPAPPYAGVFSPLGRPRRGPCEPECNVCGQVCPTGAINPLPLAQKKWAKMGTALVLPDKCLAWAENRSCVVCQETCPYAAIVLAAEPGLTVPVPVVNPARCYGCGYCEYHCPVEGRGAIVIEPDGALRLGGRPDYPAEARRKGLDLDPEERRPDHLSGDQLPPGFLE